MIYFITGLIEKISLYIISYYQGADSHKQNKMWIRFV